jgi:hypothetical protein
MRVILKHGCCVAPLKWRGMEPYPASPLGRVDLR